MKNIDDINMYSEEFGYTQQLEKMLAAKLGLEELRSGGHTIRNEKGWRENEKMVDYTWLITIARSFIGWGGLFAVRFSESRFREHMNPAGLQLGLFLISNGSIDKIYTETRADLTDTIAENFHFDLLDANKGITLDGVEYGIRINAPNIDTFIRVNNPEADKWKKWEAAVWDLGRELAGRAGDMEMIELFK